MKKILFVIFTVVIIVLIYIFTVDRKVYYLSLGDSYYSQYIKNYFKEKEKLEKYVNNFSSDKDRITDIINKINTNSKSCEVYIKNSLVKADLITISTSMDDLYLRIDGGFDDVYNYIDEFSNDLDKLFELIRIYSKEDIIFIGPSSDRLNGDFTEYFNRRIIKVCQKNRIKYVNNFDLGVLDEKIVSMRVIDVINKEG